MTTTDTRPAIEKLKEDLEQLQGEIKLKIRLGGMEIRERWQKLEPKLETVMFRMDQSLDDLGEDVRAAATKLRDDMQELWKDLKE